MFAKPASKRNDERQPEPPNQQLDCTAHALHTKTMRETWTIFKYLTAQEHTHPRLAHSPLAPDPRKRYAARRNMKADPPHKCNHGNVAAALR